MKMKMKAEDDIDAITVDTKLYQSKTNIMLPSNQSVVSTTNIPPSVETTHDALILVTK